MTSNAVTILPPWKDRDTMQQVRVPIDTLLDTLTQRLNHKYSSA